jgi:pimeloyl-ACP methyl ester carboxylesterase
MQLIKYPFEIKKVEVHSGMQMAYMDEGKGDIAMLFIHGLANYAPVWGKQIAHLSATYRCIAIDLPGNGMSDKGDYPYSIFFYAECVKRFIDKLGLKNVVLCGHSMGGQIAIVLTLRYPHLCSKLVLIAPAGIEHFLPNEVLIMKQMLSLGNLTYADEFYLERTIKQSFYHATNNATEIISDLKKIMHEHPIKMWRNMCIASINAMLDEQVFEYLPAIQPPVLIIFGDMDTLIPNTLIHFGETPYSIAQKAISRMPNARLLMINKTGHFVQMEKFDQVNAAIREFCQ